MLAVLALAPAYVLPARPATGAPTVRMVDSWYDSGVRLQSAGDLKGVVMRTENSPASEATRLLERYLQLRTCLPDAEAFLSVLVPRMKRGGRLFYIGAGTSGRLGVLDASECPADKDLANWPKSR